MSNAVRFIDKLGTFRLDNAHKSSFLYFPLANEEGMMSAITPILRGDIKSGQNSFFTPPVSVQDLHNSMYGRNFWFTVTGYGPWSAVGASSRQIADDKEKSWVEAGFLWHRVTRENTEIGIRAETTSFVPVGEGRTELMKVTVTNIGMDELLMVPTTAIPIYARSADNIRDHRHVTSLLNRIYIVDEGVEVCPTMTFDERGHKPNNASYNVYVADENGSLPIGAIPNADEFMGEGGCMEWPNAVVNFDTPLLHAGDCVEGYEAVGALRFSELCLAPGASYTYVVALTMTDTRPEKQVRGMLLSVKKFDELLEKTKTHWEKKLGDLRFFGADDTFDMWMKWVSLQPILRRIYGCSFLPHHDYGRGGRGWRDLWQDCLALMLIETDSVRPLLLNNFAGVRMDGTNATIIGSRPGEFIADRNNISRVWSDHGAWPCFTVLLYIDQSGDLDFLFERQAYFKDRLIMRSTCTDDSWQPDQGSRQKDEQGNVYMGTILEHLLVQNLCAYYNVGEHGNVRIENADWNDAFDMAADKGETVAFTAFYAGNLYRLANLLRTIKQNKGIETVQLASELMALLDIDQNLQGADNPQARRQRLTRYMQSCKHTISGSTVSVDIIRLADDLERKADVLSRNIRESEWIHSAEGYEWFNGYYDNGGHRLEGDHPNGVRMTLTGQVFPLMMGIATDEQAGKTAKSVKRYLFDEKLGGYRLNSNFGEVKLDMGRCFGFAFGQKENGAVFSHMAVMYAFALYRRGLVQEGYEVLQSLYKLSSDFERARIYPGIPEYFNNAGRGMYHYLTGAASWLLLLMLTEVYGVRGELGNLRIAPRLVGSELSGERTTGVCTVFAGRRLRIEFYSTHSIVQKATVIRVTVDGLELDGVTDGGTALIDRAEILKLSAEKQHTIRIQLE